jgi:hypothetical protein
MVPLCKYGNFERELSTPNECRAYANAGTDSGMSTRTWQSAQHTTFHHIIFPGDRSVNF